jgi:DnaJ-class molecular chaperone
MSADYIYEKEVTGDKDLEKAFRKQINTWAKSVPNQPYKNLGDQIQVTSIFYKPAYPIRLLTQYESRSKNSGHEPFENQKIPPRSIFRLEDFNSWDISLPDIETFTDKTSNYYVDGSQYVMDCFKCKANGWITCPQCQGRREVTCPNCTGAGRVTCGSCGGGGYHRCSSCGGNGKISRTVTRDRQVTRYNSGGQPYTATESYTTTVSDSCSRCGGRGQLTCSSCNGNGKVVCSRCRGRGLVTCPAYSGMGRITCPVCQGHKQLMYYFYVERALEYSDKNTCVVHENIYNTFPEFLDNYSDYESYNLMSITKNTIKQGFYRKGII